MIVKILKLRQNSTQPNLPIVHLECVNTLQENKNENTADN